MMADLIGQIFAIEWLSDDETTSCQQIPRILDQTDFRR